MASYTAAQILTPGEVKAPALHADLEHLAHDTRLVGKIMYKRQQELARRSKILNPKSFRLGVPHDVLDEQIMEKQNRVDYRAEDDAAHAQSAVLQEQVAQAVELMNAEAVKAREKAALDFSAVHLKKEYRREYHLSDPNQLRNEKVKTAEELAQSGAASCQSIGEVKSEMDAFRKKQQLETRAWLKEQMAEKEARAAAEREIDLKYDREAEFANQIRGLCEQAAIDESREEKHAEAAANLVIAEEHRQRRQAQFQKHLDANEKHVAHIMNDDRMTEGTDYIVGSNGKLSRTEYRRLSVEEEMDVHNTNAFQILGKKSRAAQEKQEDLQEAQTIVQRTHVLETIEDMKAARTAANRMRMEEYNSMLVEKRKRNARADRLAYLSFEPVDYD